MRGNLGSFLDGFASAYSHAQQLKDQREQQAWQRNLLEQKMKYDLEERKFEAQMKMKEFEFERQQATQQAKMEEQRGKEQHFNNLLDATTQLMSTRQTAQGYGEDTQAIDRLIGSMSEMGGFENPLGGGEQQRIAPGMDEGRSLPAPRTPEEAQDMLQAMGAANMSQVQSGEPGQMQAGRRTRGAQAKPVDPLKQEAEDIENRVQIATGKKALEKLGVPAEDLDPNYQWAETANSVWRSHDNTVKLTVGDGGTVDFVKRHATGVTPLDSDIIEKDPDVITEANVGLLQASRSLKSAPTQTILARYKDQVIGSAVEAYRKLNPEGKPITTSDILSDPNAAKALQIARAIDGSQATYEHLTGEQLDVQGLPSGQEFVAEGPSVLMGAYLGKYRDLRPEGKRGGQSFRGQGTSSPMPGLLPEGVEYTRTGNPKELIATSENFAAAMMSEEGEYPPDVMEGLKGLANDIASNPGTPGAVIRAWAPVFERAGIGMPRPHQKVTAPKEGSVAPAEPQTPKARQGALPGTGEKVSQAGPRVPPGAASLLATGKVVGSLGAQEDVTAVNKEFSEVKTAKDREGRAQTAVRNIKRSWANMTEDERKNLRGQWSSMKNTWKNQYKIPDRVINELDSIINPKGK